MWRSRHPLMPPLVPGGRSVMYEKRSVEVRISPDLALWKSNQVFLSLEGEVGLQHSGTWDCSADRRSRRMKRRIWSRYRTRAYNPWLRQRCLIHWATGPLGKGCLQSSHSQSCRSRGRMDKARIVAYQDHIILSFCDSRELPCPTVL